VDDKTGQIRLSRRIFDRALPAPEIGYIRTFGLNGQVRLIDRRKRAIDRLEQHSYLLRALVQPGMVAMDTGTPTTAYELPAESVDESKKAVIEDIERVRPIYTLQGPPGTGKTTLVAHLIRRILEDDPLSQILVTAQAHPAVDVLRAKVREEAYQNVPRRDQPLSIRLGSRSEKAGEVDQDSVQVVSAELMKETLAQLYSVGEVSPVQRQWISLLESGIASTTPDEPTGFAHDFTQLVKRSANITYCTTSAADLASLADGSEEFDWSFDWTIVEEAGKVHGFDLALPLQTGHRWLLLGDHKQLPPFRMEAFQRAEEALDDAVKSLSDLPDRGFIDVDWLQRWREKESPEEKRLFGQFVKRWFPTFARLFSTLRVIHGEARVTTLEPLGAKAGMLAQQWRMHPDIGGLISHVFYDGEVRNATEDTLGAAKPSFCHPLRLRGVPSEFQIEGRAIVWIDVPWCQHDAQSMDLVPRYTNPAEAKALAAALRKLELRESVSRELDVAVLSPYSQQVRLLKKYLAELPPPRGLKLLSGANESRAGARLSWAHTVDSFQGNQADVIFVSLVRNNSLLPGEGLGFLREASRLNVLLSRAERLLLLVGSWDFFVHQASMVRIENKEDLLWFLRKSLSIMQDYFISGRAVRIPATLLIEGKE
jgi:hypothetical protein